MQAPILSYATSPHASRLRNSCVSAVRMCALILAAFGFGTIAMILVAQPFAKTPRDEGTLGWAIVVALSSAIGIVGMIFARRAADIRRCQPGAVALCGRAFWFLSVGGALLLAVLMMACPSLESLADHAVFVVLGIGLWLPFLNTAVLLARLSGTERPPTATPPSAPVP